MAALSVGADLPHLGAATHPGARVGRRGHIGAPPRALPGATARPALAALLAVVAVVLAAPLLAPVSPTAQDLMVSLEPPSLNHLFGTDHLGRDILSRVAHGARTSMIVAVSAALASAALGLVAGLAGGYFRGEVDTFVSTLVDVQLAFPPILLAIAIVSALGPSLPNTILVLAVTGWTTYARVLRGEALSVREREYIHAARVLGAGHLRLVARHVLPQVLPSLLVLLTLQLGRMVVLEATLSFLGLGVQPPEPSWGNLLADSRDYVTTAWWVALFPGLAITLTVWAVNLAGDWLRDRLDPRLGR